MRLGIDIGRAGIKLAVMADAELVAEAAADRGRVAPAIQGALRNLPVAELEAAVVTTDLCTADPAPTAVLRIGPPCHESLAPRADVREVVSGGHTLTGQPLAELDARAVREFAHRAGVTSFAVTAMGSPVRPEHELAAAEIITNEVPGAQVTLSYEFGRVGLRERENSAALNAALRPAADLLVDTLRGAVDTRLFFARNVEGLVSEDYFRRFPLVAFASRAGTTLCGAARLAGVSDAVVADVGAEEVRIGQVAAGRPKVRDAPGPDGAMLSITLPVLRRIPPGALGTPEPDSNALAVGDAPPALPGWRQVPYAPLAGAIGAATAEPAAEVERIVLAIGDAELRQELDDTRGEALAKVISAGADPATARVVTSACNPISYLPDGVYRVFVQAEGRRA
ncbi:hydantoinase/oxoprolinase N-terminal domain-containing protein [Amycolatopsis anabasis]|uniref:hydantoinase/oxoprolinase N-terminal domain-containing protein n=1 Tax=Amycolatopsis anabasis TaxID=1840409 RepID=UPI00131D0CE4|nr:hydantoinase/oxoprolinase N-terminal domain-containing protein [Amycolatopsis anabasis]